MGKLSLSMHHGQQRWHGRSKVNIGSVSYEDIGTSDNVRAGGAGNENTAVSGTCNLRSRLHGG